MRTLASIQIVKNLTPIPNADSIVRVNVLGWEVVIRKGEFQEGDLCVYCEIDSVLPERPEFEFLRSNNFRIRTIRLKGQVSQGICLPVTILPPNTSLEIGKDVTSLLNITKYERPEVDFPDQLRNANSFPDFIPKTDETRVQVLAEKLELYAGEKCYITEKVDGSSITIYLIGKEVRVCSRNLELDRKDGGVYWETVLKLGLEDIMFAIRKEFINYDFPDRLINFALQGELLGPKIQQNKYKLTEPNILFFGLYDIIQQKYIRYEQFKKLSKFVELVPILDEDFELHNDISKLVNMAKGTSKLCGILREGIVIRTLQEVGKYISKHEPPGTIIEMHPSQKRIFSCKSINPDFLLKYTA